MVGLILETFLSLIFNYGK